MLNNWAVLHAFDASPLKVVVRAQEAPLVHVPVAAAEGVLWLIIDRGG
jgi:hypothetical protein